MAEKWKVRVHKLGEEANRTGRVVLKIPALTRWAERGIRLLLGAILAGADVFGGYAPFGVGMVAASGAGMDGLCALLGACFGYFTFRGFTDGLRYAAACVLVFSVAFAFYDIKICRSIWFLPLIASVMDAITGFVYLSDAAWRVSEAVFFSTEVLFAGVSAYLYRLALSPWKDPRENAPLNSRQGMSLCFLLGTLLVSLTGVTFLEDLSLGRTAAILLTMAIAHAGGQGTGAAAGVACGVCVDLAAFSSPFYTMAYGFSGLLTGAGWQQGRLFGALTYVVSNAAAVLWTWSGSPRISCLYEAFIASIFFLLLPRKWMRQLSEVLRRRREEDTAHWAARLVSERLDTASKAFQQVFDSLRRAFPSQEPNDDDASAIFDRTAERVCRRCALRNTCWERDYVSTFNALNDALPTILERGKGEAVDFPGWFSSRCLRFPAFLRTVSEEAVALLYRREYKARLAVNRRAVCRQYETLAEILSDASVALAAELTPDPIREKRLRTHLVVLDVEGEVSVCYDAEGHLRCEVKGGNLAPLSKPEEVRKISELLGVTLRIAEESIDRIVYVQAEPLIAVAGLAARRREGQRESGDTGTWFKRDDGSLFVLLCDGMGSGAAAHRESALAVHLLEEFLRSGLNSAAALRTVNGALNLKNEDTGAFTTVDLLRIDLFTGEGEVCKLGAAPTYIRRAEGISRLTGSSLPAGLAGDGGPDQTKFNLSPGDCVLLMSDGVADADDDQWVREALAHFHGESPKDLAQMIMEESEQHTGAMDDRTVVVVRLGARKGNK